MWGFDQQFFDPLTFHLLTFPLRLTAGKMQSKANYINPGVCKRGDFPGGRAIIHINSILQTTLPRGKFCQFVPRSLSDVFCVMICVFESEISGKFPRNQISSSRGRWQAWNLCRQASPQKASGSHMAAFSCSEGAVLHAEKDVNACARSSAIIPQWPVWDYPGPVWAYDNGLH